MRIRSLRGLPTAPERFIEPQQMQSDGLPGLGQAIL